MDEGELHTALADHAITHKGKTYHATLVRFRPDPTRVDTVDLDFAATPNDGGGDPITFSLRLSRDTLNDEPYVLRAIDGTVIAIIDGHLPPGTRELL